MRIDLVEKLILLLAGMAVLAVAAFVTFCSLLPGGLRHGIPPVVEQAALDTQDWLLQQRRRSGRASFAQAQLNPGDVAFRAPPAPASPAGGGGDAPATSPPVATTDYFVAEGNIPPAQQIPGFPWLKQVPGVSYAQPQQVPDILYRKYQSFEATWDLVQEGGGNFTTARDGKTTAYQVNWIDEHSYLAQRVGLRPGDKVISVNGQPIGTSLGAGKAMYEQMKNERRFAVLIERNGEPMVLSFFVQ
ncbi:MAG: hypothetical protein M9894_40115 [Planctomycetes bacterium]|nr:hypothetical protein [Planctomycetota bacterium]